MKKMQAGSLPELVRMAILVVVSEAVKTEDGSKFEIEYSDGQKRYGGIGNYIGVKLAQATRKAPTSMSDQRW